jgi:hypothetical protein
MIGAVITHLLIGGSPAIPIALFVALSGIAYLRRHQLAFFRS